MKPAKSRPQGDNGEKRRWSKKVRGREQKDVLVLLFKTVGNKLKRGTRRKKNTAF